MPERFISRENAEQDLLDCAAFLAERIRSSDGHAEAMKIIVPMYLERGEVDLAAELANAIEDPFSRDQLLLAVAVKCAETDDEEYALQLTEAIEDHAMQAQALERIGVIAAERGRYDRAGEVADMMGHPDFVFAGIAVSEASKGDADAAYETVENIEFPTARVQALQQIAAAQIGSGELEKGATTLAAAVDETDNIEHDEERIRTLCELGNVFLDAKANDKAIKTFEKARTLAEELDNQHRDYFLVTSAMGMLNSGSVDLADRTLDLVMDKTQMASAMVGFARHYWGKDQKEEAVDALEEAYAILKSQRENETRDSRARNGLFVTVAAQFAGFGKAERAAEIALENPDPEQQMNALGQVAQVLTVQNEPDAARDTIAQIEEDSNRLFALIAVADAQRKLGKNDEAGETLKEAFSMSDSVPQMSSRSEALNELADRFLSIGDAQRSREAAVENLGLIAQIRDESSRAAAIANLAAVYNKGEFTLGEAEFETIRPLVGRAEFQ